MWGGGGKRREKVFRRSDRVSDRWKGAEGKRPLTSSLAPSPFTRSPSPSLVLALQSTLLTSSVLNCSRRQASLSLRACIAGEPPVFFFSALSARTVLICSSLFLFLSILAASSSQATFIATSSGLGTLFFEEGAAAAGAPSAEGAFFFSATMPFNSSSTAGAAALTASVVIFSVGWSVCGGLACAVPLGGKSGRVGDRGSEGQEEKGGNNRNDERGFWIKASFSKRPPLLSTSTSFSSPLLSSLSSLFWFWFWFFFTFFGSHFFSLALFLSLPVYLVVFFSFFSFFFFCELRNEMGTMRMARNDALPCFLHRRVAAALDKTLKIAVAVFKGGGDNFSPPCDLQEVSRRVKEQEQEQ